MSGDPATPMPTDRPTSAAAMHPIEGFVQPHLAAANLRRITLSGRRTGTTPAESPIRKAVIRPVEVRGQRVLQVVAYDERQSTTTNVSDAPDAPPSPILGDVLQLPFRHVVVELTTEILEGRVTKKGGLVTSRKRIDEQPIVLAHDRQKTQPIPEDAPFLERLGISVEGRVKPSRQAKYRQINAFVRLLDGASVLDQLPRNQPVTVVDLGCGNAYLTFATYHHLTTNRGFACELVGVDRNTELIERNQARAESLGWHGLRFEAGDIESFEPKVRPNIVIALHACDTASDHALAAVVRWQSDVAMVAPCCHHHVQAQLHGASVAASEALLLRHGILGERLGDVLTDAARAAILRLLGFEVDVVEFVSPEHTPKNLLIRASNRSLPVPSELVDAYDALTKRWAISPFLGELLADELTAAVARRGTRHA